MFGVVVVLGGARPARNERALGVVKRNSPEPERRGRHGDDKTSRRVVYIMIYYVKRSEGIPLLERDFAP